MAINAWSKFVLHDNTRPYKEMVKEEIVTYLVCSVHTLDLPDIAPTDYYFFLLPQNAMIGQCFSYEN